MVSRKLREPWVRRVLLGGVAVAAAVFVLFAFAPARQAAAQFLQLFRVQSITVVPVSEERLQQLDDIEAILESGIVGKPTVLREPSESQAMADADAAGELAGIRVREPAQLPEGMVRREAQVIHGPAMRLDMTREQMQAILDQAGLADEVSLPQMDELSVSVDVPKGVVLSYGIGPSGEEPGRGAAPAAGAEGPSRPRSFRDGKRLEVVQIPSPLITLPEGVDPAALGESLLQLFGLAKDDAARLAATIDWTSTLVLPMPSGVDTFQEVTVDGAKAVLLLGDGDDERGGRQRAVVWQKDGLIHGVAGWGLSDVELLQAADSLR